ncbi:flagellar motor switch protein FliM [Arthrobacter sulfonylureivorans]|uniref:Flagellar motor switch protein FliM n=1 Tax=Arthrobacter sulfonylureivorans TaxID=2486855 RepID=A0ABY3W8X1_9MICC|nr:flagellar motor switch protein FliM [Arthrobacter sulfonylureivorans]UNK46812.1 flagellar motor switch protein FliM [Arthrobacter sulfonylureivorans]
MTVQEHVQSNAPEKPARAVEVYDFRRPTTLAREHSRVLELAFETFARQWGTQLTAKVRVICTVTSEQVQMQTYDEYAASLPASTAMVLCALDDITGKAVLQFPTKAAMTWVDHMLGGNGTHNYPDRKFTQIEQALVSRLMEDALEDLRYSLGSLLTTPISLDQIHYNSQFAQAAATNDLMIVATFEIRVGDLSAPATVAIPAEVLLTQLRDSFALSSPANARKLLETQLVQIPVDVSLQFAPMRVRPGQVLDLSVGDLLPLPHPQHRPLDVAINGECLAHAAVGANGNRLAGVIVTTEENAR